MKNITVLLFLCFTIFNSVSAQEKEALKIDATKPTNLYTQVNTVLEYQDFEAGKGLIGTRVSLSITFDPDNLLYAEIPLLHNSESGKFGVNKILNFDYLEAEPRRIHRLNLSYSPSFTSKMYILSTGANLYL